MERGRHKRQRREKITKPKKPKPEQNAQNPRKNPKTDDLQTENPIKINQNRNR